MRILVLGASGFVGSRLVSELLAHRSKSGEPVSIIASDLREPNRPWTESAGDDLRFVTGNITDPALFDVLFDQEIDVVYHLAATLTIDAEMDFAHGLNVNVRSMLELLERCRAQTRAPKLVFASSISTFGGVLPEVVDDYVIQTPQTSYGTHKVIGEHLINDYSRRGYIDGRALRLPIVLTHPGPSSNSVSDRIAALIREPLNGRAATCPLDPETPIAVASVDKVVAALLTLADVPASALEGSRALNLPALTVTLRQIAEAVQKRHPGAADRLITWAAEPSIQSVVEGWPTRFTSDLALRLGITTDTSAEAIVDAYVAARDASTCRTEIKP